MGRYTEQITGQATLALCVAAVLVFLIVARAAHARWGATGRAFLIAEYAPPGGLNVMVAAHLVGRSRSAVPAQLLQLAIQKNIRVLDRSLRRGKRAYAVQFITLEGADSIGQLMLRALFGAEPVAGSVRELRASNARMRNNVANVSAYAFGVARANGWRKSASILQWLILVAAAVLELAILVGSFMTWVVSEFSPLYVLAFFVGIGVLTLSILTFRFYGPLTDAGAVVRDHLVGLRIYLELAEEQRLAMLRGALTADRASAPGGSVAIRVYEKLLPYAVVWKVERSWITALIGDAIDLDRAPEWMSDLNQLSVLNTSNVLTQWARSAFRQADL